jgi:hypothetical protein
MAPGLLDLPLEMLTDVCHQLDLRDRVRTSETCKRLRHGDGVLEPVELPSKSPVVAALGKHAFPGISALRVACGGGGVYIDKNFKRCALETH